MAEYCPVLRPTFQEFSHTKEYIKSIEHIVTKYGICKIIPPPCWNPRHSAQCLCGPGNFDQECKHKVNIDTKSDCDSKPQPKKGEMKYDTNRFGDYNQNADQYIKSCTKKSSECLCSFNDIFGDDMRDSVFNIHSNNTAMCPYFVNQYGTSDGDDVRTEGAQQDSHGGYPASFDELLSNTNIETQHRHRFGHVLDYTIQRLSMNDTGASVHVYLPYDHLWYEAVIVHVDVSTNACDIKLVDHSNASIITIHPMECIVIKTKKTDTITEISECKCCCSSMFAHQLPSRLQEMSSITDPSEMGKIPPNKINGYVSMKPDYYNVADKTGAGRSISDITLDGKTLHDTNDKMQYLADMIIKAPIRQNLYQSPDAKGGVYHCVNVVEHERMSVRYFYTKTQKELETEMKESKKTKEIMEWIENDAIEQHIEDIQREWIRNLTYRHPLYGADTIGSLFHPEALWNLANLDTILELLSTDIEGVTMPYLYFGSWRSMFAWHIEDRALWALNYLHFGKPKVWFGIPPSESYKMEQLMANNFPKDAAYCRVFTRHKSSFIVPKILTKAGVVYYRAVQRANEIIITAPNAYHSGFNLGFNCAEAVNIATPSWIPLGINAAHCQCGIMQSSVQFDINALVERIKNKYPRLAPEIPKLPNNYKKILQQQNAPKRQLDCYYVPPSKRAKLCLSETPTPYTPPNSSTGSTRGKRRGRASRKPTNDASEPIKTEYQYTTKKRKGYGRSRARARRIVRQ